MDQLKKSFSISKGNHTQKNFYIGFILRGLIFGFLLSLICFLIISIILSFSSISESIIKPSSYIIMVVSIVIASGYTSRKVDKNGWLYGAITGLLYVIILTIAGMITSGGFSLEQIMISRVLMGLIAGTIGGILGINLK